MFLLQCKLHSACGRLFEKLDHEQRHFIVHTNTLFCFLSSVKAAVSGAVDLLAFLSRVFVWCCCCYNPFHLSVKVLLCVFGSVLHGTHSDVSAFVSQIKYVFKSVMNCLGVFSTSDPHKRFALPRNSIIQKSVTFLLNI